mmetsp:Transcript_37270/g.105221  ORF Transcript_37270/g.105221 Transcript_37270/m.105221 type:complete len:98 (+) Transcript_37270:3-296(+)
MAAAPGGPRASRRDAPGSAALCDCGRAMQRADPGSQVYGSSMVPICDACHEPCAAVGPGDPPGAFLHCALCRYDLCTGCAAPPSTRGDGGGSRGAAA